MLSPLAGRVGWRLWLCDTCLCVDDQSRSLAADTTGNRRSLAPDAIAGSALRSVCQPLLPANWQPLGGVLQIHCGTGRKLSLLACQRYIELNPLRAGMVADPGQYRWSSYWANGLGQPDVRLNPHERYLSLGRNGVGRQTAYRALFRPELDAEAIDDIRQALQLGMPIGSERFAETICSRLCIRHNSGKRGRPDRPPNEANTQPMTEQQDFGF